VIADLPAGWSTRRPTIDDVPEILAMIHASDIAAVGEPDFTSEEVIEVLTGPNHDPKRDSWLAVNENDRVVGWAFLENTTRGERDLFDVYVHPDYGRPAQAHLLDLVLGRIPGRAGEFGHPEMTARAGAIASETNYIGLLQAAGFEFKKRYARMQRELTGDEQVPEFPDRVTIRNVRHDDDAEMQTFHRILETAFADLPDYLPFDYVTFRQRLAALPSITWDEWFIAEFDDVPAAILQSADQSTERNEGWVKNLAVAKEFRGRGLGGLLLRTAFATYAAKSRTSAGLGVDMTNPTGAYRLYERVGMHAAYEADVYERTVAAAE
jgi:mycothiol synthase